MGNSAPQSLRDKWDVYIGNLISHENGHRDLARQAVKEINRAVWQMPPARTCGELDRKVQAFARNG